MDGGACSGLEVSSRVRPPRRSVLRQNRLLQHGLDEGVRSNEVINSKLEHTNPMYRYRSIP